MGGLVHVGAWHGLEYLGTSRRLLLFEPQAEAFATLKANFAGCRNVEIVNVALGAEDGEAVMHHSDPSHSSSLLQPTWRGDDGITFGGTETVQVITLDEAMVGRRGFDELRIDTQGYELEVLRGAARTLRRMRRVELEVHNPDVYSGAGSLEDIDVFLSERGFERTKLDVPGQDDLADVVYERTIKA